MTAGVIEQSEPMVLIPTRLIRELKGTELMVYAAIAAYGHRNPRTAQLADILGVSIHTVRYAIQQLRKKGYITTTKSEGLNYILNV